MNKSEVSLLENGCVLHLISTSISGEGEDLGRLSDVVRGATPSRQCHWWTRGDLSDCWRYLSIRELWRESCAGTPMVFFFFPVILPTVRQTKRCRCHITFHLGGGKYTTRFPFSKFTRYNDIDIAPSPDLLEIPLTLLRKMVWCQPRFLGVHLEALGEPLIWPSRVSSTAKWVGDLHPSCALAVPNQFPQQ